MRKKEIDFLPPEPRCGEVVCDAARQRPSRTSHGGRTRAHQSAIEYAGCEDTQRRSRTNEPVQSFPGLAGSSVPAPDQYVSRQRDSLEAGEGARASAKMTAPRRPTVLTRRLTETLW
jgi:hypothetical protein